MEGNAEQKVIEAHQEVALVLSQWRIAQAKDNNKGVARPAQLTDKGSAITNPSGYWATALTSTESSKAAIELGLLLAAAKLRAGDISFVVESGIGQIAWLSSLALELKEDADRQPVESAARARLLQLSLRAQGAAAKLMLSLGALAKMGDTHSILEVLD
jgi:hypothetical protein